MVNYDRIRVAGRDEDIAVVGSDEQYANVRNLVLLAGRFVDANDVAMRSKVCMLTEKLAKRLYGSQNAAIGQRIKLHGLQFDVIGTFKEKTESFGLSELAAETVFIPITVMRYFVPTVKVDPLYVQARRAEDVAGLTSRGEEHSREPPPSGRAVQGGESVGDSGCGAEDLDDSRSIVLLLVSAIALIISGIGIMNIMLVTVTERTREIGLRMAVGAARRDVLEQFLAEAMLISVAGGAIGILIGVALPLTVNFLFPEIRIPISVWSVVIAFGVSMLVGLIFGIVPANRAARLNPTEALRYE